MLESGPKQTPPLQSDQEFAATQNAEFASADFNFRAELQESQHRAVVREVVNPILQNQGDGSRVAFPTAAPAPRETEQRIESDGAVVEITSSKGPSLFDIAAAEAARAKSYAYLQGGGTSAAWDAAATASNRASIQGINTLEVREERREIQRADPIEEPEALIIGEELGEAAANPESVVEAEGLGAREALEESLGDADRDDLTAELDLGEELQDPLTDYVEVMEAEADQREVIEPAAVENLIELSEELSEEIDAAEEMADPLAEAVDVEELEGEQERDGSATGLALAGTVAAEIDESVEATVKVDQAARSEERSTEEDPLATIGPSLARLKDDVLARLGAEEDDALVFGGRQAA